MEAQPEIKYSAQANGLSIYVKEWIDSSNYGLGYLLTNNTTGYLFNDSTQIVMDPNGKTFYYCERKTSSNS